MTTPVLNSPQRYTKKPVTIEAMRYTDIDAASEIITWASEQGATISYWCPNDEACRKGADGHVLRIPTLEGNMDAKPGDYVIRGIQGEFYPCKPDIFAATYDAENTVTVGDITINATLTEPEVLASVVGRTLLQNAQLNG